MTTFRAFLFVCLFGLATALRVHAAPVVADVQVIETGPSTWIVRISVTEAQAFDVSPDDPRRVRLHGATLGRSRAPVDPAPFGTIVLTQTKSGVDERVKLAGARYSIEAVQGASPSLVELRIAAR